MILPPKEKIGFSSSSCSIFHFRVYSAHLQSKKEVSALSVHPDRKSVRFLFMMIGCCRTGIG